MILYQIKMKTKNCQFLTAIFNQSVFLQNYESTIKLKTNSYENNITRQDFNFCIAFFYF